MNTPLVIDASVILKWVLPADAEAYQNQAFALADAIFDRRSSVALPDLWYFEVGNTLSRKYPDQANDDLADLRVQLASFVRPMTMQWQSRILDLTARYPVTFHDASYHALAIVLQGTFITADEKYLAAADEAGHMLHLKDFR